MVNVEHQGLPSLPEFTLLTNHTLVLAVIAKMPDVRMREIASIVGITERAVQRIVDDLTRTGYVAVTKSGRRNRYDIRSDSPLKHSLASHRNVGELVSFVFPHHDLKN
jgi:DNA-binding MarR family transcriptional regulator